MKGDSGLLFEDCSLILISNEIKGIIRTVRFRRTSFSNGVNRLPQPPFWAV